MGAVALFVGLGLGRFAYSPMIPALVQAGWFRPAAADYLGAVNLLGYLIGAAVTGQWLAHRAPGVWLRWALVVTAGSLAACALPWGFAWYFLWRLLAGIAAGVLMVLAVPAVLARVPERRRGVLGGVTFGGVGVGMIFSVLVMYCIILTAAVAFHGHQNIQSAQQAAQALKPVAGSASTEMSRVGSPFTTKISA